MTITKGPPVPLPGYKGTRFDPPAAWLFGKGVYGPPDERPSGLAGYLGRFTKELARSQLAEFAGMTPERLFKRLYTRETIQAAVRLMAKQYGITVTSKDGTKEATEWFGSEVERDQFFAWYRDHGRTAVRVEWVDERAARQELLGVAGGLLI